MALALRRTTFARPTLALETLAATGAGTTLALITLRATCARTAHARRPALPLITAATGAASHARKRIGIVVVDVHAVAVRLIRFTRFACFTFAAPLGGRAAIGVRRFLFNAVGGQHVAHFVFFQLFPTAAFQAAWQRHRAVTGADQARHGQADRLEHAPYFAVAAFADDHAIPLVDTLATAVGNFRELRNAVFQFDAGQQFLAHAFAEFTQRAHRVFAIDAVTRVHQAVGQVARGRKQQQALGIEVEPAHRQPLARLHRRQTVEHRWPAIRIVMTDDLASRLMVHQHARRLLADAALDQFTIDPHMVGRQDALANMGRLAIHRDPAGHDQVFHVAARTEARFGQHLVQLGRIVVRRQVAPHHFLRCLAPLG